MATQQFNEKFISTFSKPQPVPRARKVLQNWMGSGYQVIDVGCGSGYYAAMCQAQGNRVAGIDITSQVQAVRDRGVPVCMGNLESALPFPGNTFSMALCIEVVEHLLEPDRMISEIHRVLKPGGVLLITTPNYAYWVLRLLFLFGHLPVGLNPRQLGNTSNQPPPTNPPPWRDPHIRLFSPSILRQFLHEHGFVVESIRSSFVAFPSGLAPYLPFGLGLPLRAMGKLIGNLNFLGDYFPALLSAGLLVRAVKR